LDANGNLKDSGKKAADFVEMTGAQTVAGVKTFSSIPVLPASNPTDANQAARKAYVDDNFVKMTGDQTVAGVKTFSSIPVLPGSNPTADNQAARKKYIDDNFVNVTGAQTVAGAKTFSSIPVLPASDPTDGNQAARKAYVDSKFAAVPGGSGSGKKYATFVIGNTGAGHTQNDVDYLCNGTNDHTVINNAIAALPAGGGKIIIREGTYNLGGPIILNKKNVVLQGMGPSTVLNATKDITPATVGYNFGTITIKGDYCEVSDLKVTNNSNVNAQVGIFSDGYASKIHRNVIENLTYSINSNYGIAFTVPSVTGKDPSFLTISENIIINKAKTGACVGIYLFNGSNGSDNIIIGNYIESINNSSYAAEISVCIRAEGQNIRVINNNIYTNRGYAIEITNYDNVIVADNIIGNASTAIYFKCNHPDNACSVIIKNNCMKGMFISNPNAMAFKTDGGGFSFGSCTTLERSGNAVIGFNIV
jgi:hypothetical protein